MDIAVAMDSLEALPEIGIKFAFAVALSGLVGLERERKGRGAGLRTHILVCLGATLIMVVADWLAEEWNDTGGFVWLDKGRIAAGIITGVGFLGAGTIMNVGGEQRGITTAAMIWFAAALGIAIGVGYVFLATFATLCALLVVLFFDLMERGLPSREAYSLSLSMPNGLEQLAAIEDAIRDEGFQVLASRLKVEASSDQADMTFQIRTRSKIPIERLVQNLRDRFSSVERIICER